MLVKIWPDYGLFGMFEPPARRVDKPRELLKAAYRIGRAGVDLKGWISADCPGNIRAAIKEAHWRGVCCREDAGGLPADNIRGVFYEPSPSNGCSV
jgi:hypothetical protein